MGTHSLVGASTFKRSKKCPGWINQSKGIEVKSSSYADEGTEAHEVAAKTLLSKTVSCSVEMFSAVKIYTDLIFSEWDKESDERLVEHRFDLSHLHPYLGGTADCVIYKPEQKKLIVYDYKHGQGLPVEVIEDGEPNDQLMYYAAGALLTCNFPATTVEIVVVQPRCYHPDGPVRRLQLDAVRLIDFVADMIAVAKKTEDPNAPLLPGGHCRFCPAAAKCPAIGDKALEIAKNQFSPVAPYEPEKLSKTLEWIDVLENWCKQVREFAYGEALHGRIPPKHKLVAKRASRKFIDEKLVLERLRANFKYRERDYYEDPSFKSVAGIEKVIGKKEMEKINDLISQESSGFVLVHESDKRPAVLNLNPESQFSQITNNE